MAIVIGSLQAFDKLETETWAENDARTKKLIDDMQEQSDNLPEGEVVGGIITFPVADGRAIYQVVKAKPLQLAHVPFGDAWHASEITIRGLNIEDVKLMLKRSKALPRLKPLVHIPLPQAALETLDDKKAAEAHDNSHELSPFKTLYKRENGEVFGISHTAYGEYQSVVPSDLAAAGEGYQHKTSDGAESYLWELIYKEINVDKRFKDAIQNAEFAFWGEIANAYPEIKSGDLGPDIVIPFGMMMEKAVAAWLKGNAPEGTDVAKLVHSDMLPGNEDDKGVLEVIKPTRSSEFPSRDEVARIKEKYPVGTRIRVEHMPNDPDPIPYGTQGVVQDVDDVGQLVMKWDNGRTLSLIPGVDQFGVVKVSLEDFVATRKWSEDIEAYIGFDNGAGKIKGYIYRESLYIQQEDDGTYYLPIERDEYRSPKLEELEKTLYDMHFALIGY